MERGVAWCRRNGIAPAVHAQGGGREGDLIVAVGGDGTFLRAASLVYPRAVPILGVNAGGLGFLCSCEAKDIEEALGEAVAGRCAVERRARLTAEGPGSAGSALNDVVVVGPNGKRFTTLEVAVDGEPAFAVEGDGLIVATPTGSTAYALAAGGPILSPDVPALLLVPLAPHRLGVRPLVVPEGTRVTIRAQREGRVLLDGDPMCNLAPGDTIAIARAEAETLFLRLTGSFWGELKAKLGLAG